MARLTELVMLDFTAFDKVKLKPIFLNSLHNTQTSTSTIIYELCGFDIVFEYNTILLLND